MVALIHTHRRVDQYSPGCPEPADIARNMDVRTMEGDESAAEPHLAEEGGDDGDGDDVDNSVANMATVDRFGCGVVDLAAIVDSVLADLPEPARHHILPALEEAHGGGVSPGLVCSAF